MVMGVRVTVSVTTTKCRHVRRRETPATNLRRNERAGQTRLRQRSIATVNELFRQVRYYQRRAADIEERAEDEQREPTGFELDQIDHCLGIVRSILYNCMPYQFPKLATVEITPNEEAMAGALARIAEAMSLPARVQEEEIDAAQPATGAADLPLLDDPTREPGPVNP